MKMFSNMVRLNEEKLLDQGITVFDITNLSNNSMNVKSALSSYNSQTNIMTVEDEEVVQYLFDNMLELRNQSDLILTLPRDLLRIKKHPYKLSFRYSPTLSKLDLLHKNTNASN